MCLLSVGPLGQVTFDIFLTAGFGHDTEMGNYFAPSQFCVWERHNKGSGRYLQLELCYVEFPLDDDTTHVLCSTGNSVSR